MSEVFYQQQPTAMWNTARGVWEKPGMVNLLCEHWELFSVTWPTSGMTRSGQAYELPTLAHLTTDLESSSSPILRTPAASEAERGHQSEEVARARGGQLGKSLGVALRMEQSEETKWGKFEPAIRRWEEVLGRPAPAPTKPDGKDGAHRLSSKFTEWMMGLPDGWITDHGLSRNDELKMAGNGVCPQQAELALRTLLQGVSFDPIQGGVMLPTPTVSDTFTSNLKSTQQKPDSMHSVTLPQAIERLLPSNKVLE